jgi:methylmalonyl-CoA/ethylmalonyl-CoA epimerase
MADSVFTDANHICIVTHDIERAVRTWSDRYGVGPWRVYSYDDENMAASVDGQPVAYRMRAALCSLGPHFRIEIIQPLDDLSPYSRSLIERGGADHIHHVRLDVTSYDAAAEHLGKLGVPVTMDAAFKGGGPADRPRLSATYFATDADLGFTLEICRPAEGFVMPEPDSVYPAE